MTNPFNDRPSRQAACLPACLSLCLPLPPNLCACLTESQVGWTHILSKVVETIEYCSLPYSQIAGEFQALILPAEDRRTGGNIGKLPLKFWLFLDSLLLFLDFFHEFTMSLEQQGVSGLKWCFTQAYALCSCQRWLRC